MKGYITKYALSIGITEQEFRMTGRVDSKGNAYATWYTDGYYSGYKLGRDVFESREDAVKDAEKRRVKKIESLRKQIRKLEAMVF